MKKSIAIGAILSLTGISTVMLASCATTVVPPATPDQPVTVYLIDQGRTSTLAMPHDDGEFVRYVYGDWEWYALREESLGRGVVALVGPTQGAIGRKIIDQPADVEDMLRKFEIGAENIFTFEADRERVQEFNAEMDEIFRANADSLVVNEAYALEFVHHPDRYAGLHNSNHVTAEWLRDLGCETRGPAMTSQWKMK